MVDVGAKAVTARLARAAGRVRMRAATLRAVAAGQHAKGDVLGVARLAGIQAAKHTAALIPLCHVLPLDHVDVELRLDRRRGSVEIASQVRCRGATGVEMEAIIAVCVAAATVYDMCKSVDRSMRIEGIELLEKRGGKSGDYAAPGAAGKSRRTPARRS
jgi:cyclic pyranopterin phosphate synthase